MPRRPRFGMHFVPENCSFPELRAFWSHAEALGYDWISTLGHLLPVWTAAEGPIYETSATLAALAASTRSARISTLTLCNGFRPPALLAKYLATIDHISGGRWGLNIVCGWYTTEMEMFGAKQMAHDDRYRYASEWIQVIKRLWTEQHFDYEGTFFRVKDGYLLPKPVQEPYPVLINAGSSPAGRDFSAREVDFNFVSIDTLENGKEMAADVRRRAQEYGREIGVMTYGLVVCRDTEKEATQAYDYIVEKGDWEATHNIMRTLGVESGSFDSQIKQFAERFIAGWGGYPMVGTPEQVVEEMLKLSRIGIEGVILSWLDYNQEIQYFGEKILPLMRQAGLRT